MSPKEDHAAPAPGQGPIDAVNFADPGDDTQRNFRYQHAYGVVLLAAALTGRKKYVSLWCEQHEDLLGELADGGFEGFQIKTRKPELGEWDLNDDELRASIKRFTEFERRFPGRMTAYHFVSNAECSNSEAADRLRRSPRRLLAACKDAEEPANILEPLSEAFEKLRDHCGCEAPLLLHVLQRLAIVKGPGRDTFEAELSHDHIATISTCRAFSTAQLKTIRNGLIDRVARASSVSIDDPAKHWACVDGIGVDHPRLVAKGIRIDDVLTWLKDKESCPFRFETGQPLLALSGARTMRVLQEKMTRGGVADQVDTIGKRARAAERHLLAEALVRPEDIDAMLNQLEAVVKGECDEAYLTASQSPEPFGRAMLADVHARLRHTATARPSMVLRQEYECLVGVAGLLTEDCHVWWSKPFDVGGQG